MSLPSPDAPVLLPPGPSSTSSSGGDPPPASLAPGLSLPHASTHTGTYTRVHTHASAFLVSPRLMQTHLPPHRRLLALTWCVSQQSRITPTPSENLESVTSAKPLLQGEATHSQVGGSRTWRLPEAGTPSGPSPGQLLSCSFYSPSGLGLTPWDRSLSVWLRAVCHPCRSALSLPCVQGHGLPVLPSCRKTAWHTG